MSDRILKESDVLKIAFQLPLVVNSMFADAVKALPSADRPQGEWRGEHKMPDMPRYEWYRCSECNFLSQSVVNFCPNCGADMRGE